MGWWTLEQSGAELLQGDIPLDLMMDAFHQIAQEYEQDWGRKPTLAEVIQTIEATLKTEIDVSISEEEEIEIVHLAVKTRKRRKYQTIQVGDFFAIPLERKLYAFGRILSDLKLGEISWLVGIYDEVSARILSPAHLKGKQFMFTPFYCDDQGLKTWKWKIIGNLPVEADEFEYPKHKEGLEGMGWWIRDKDRVYEATAEEVQDLEYATLWSTTAVEKRIMEFIGRAQS